MAEVLVASSDEAFNKLVQERHILQILLYWIVEMYTEESLEKEAPQSLVNANNKKTVFVFGEDAIT